MKTKNAASSIRVPCEAERNGFTIYIEANPDWWCGGYLWSVCKCEVAWEEGLSFTSYDAIQSANEAIATLQQPLLS